MKKAMQREGKEATNLQKVGQRDAFTVLAQSLEVLLQVLDLNRIEMCARYVVRGERARDLVPHHRFTITLFL